MQQGLAALGALAIAFAGLAIANVLVDRGVDSYVARRVPASLGGIAYLVAVLNLAPWTAVAMSAAVTLAFGAYRLRTPGRHLRGVAGSSPSQRWVELTYLSAATASLLVGWAWLGDRLLAFVPIAFMAWGDSAAALTYEWRTFRRRQASLWPLLAMLMVCLVIAAAYTPYWIGALGAVSATLAGRFPPRVLGTVDDNWWIVAAALGTMGTAGAVVGAI